MTSGSASDASCHSLSVIIAIPRKSESAIPPRSFISPICITNLSFPAYSAIFLISAAAIIAPIYIGNVIPVCVSAHENTVPIPIAIISWNTAAAYICV